VGDTPGEVGDVREDEAQGVQQGPLLAEGDDQEAQVQDRKVGHQGDLVVLAGAEQEWGQKTADHRQGRQPLVVVDHCQGTAQRRDQDHHAKGKGLSEQLVDLETGERREIEDRHAAARQTEPENPVVPTAEELSRSEQPDPPQKRQCDPAGRTDPGPVKGVFQKVPHRQHDDDHSDGQDPLLTQANLHLRRPGDGARRLLRGDGWRRSRLCFRLLLRCGGSDCGERPGCLRFGLRFDRRGHQMLAQSRDATIELVQILPQPADLLSDDLQLLPQFLKSPSPLQFVIRKPVAALHAVPGQFGDARMTLGALHDDLLGPIRMVRCTLGTLSAIPPPMSIASGPHRDTSPRRFA